MSRMAWSNALIHIIHYCEAAQFSGLNYVMCTPDQLIKNFLIFFDAFEGANISALQRICSLSNVEDHGTTRTCPKCLYTIQNTRNS